MSLLRLVALGCGFRILRLRPDELVHLLRGKRTILLCPVPVEIYGSIPLKVLFFVPILSFKFTPEFFPIL
jgi:hypothetical protein